MTDNWRPGIRRAIIVYVIFKSVIYQRYIVSHAKVLHAVCDNEICSISDYVGYPTLLCKILGIRSEHANTLHIDESNGDIGNVEYDVYVSKQNKNIRNIVLIDIFNEVYENQLVHCLIG